MLAGKGVVETIWIAENEKCPSLTIYYSRALAENAEEHPKQFHTRICVQALSDTLQVRITVCSSKGTLGVGGRRQQHGTKIKKETLQISILLSSLMSAFLHADSHLV